jgi:exo-beta-1,3-glucanase (GH17 family)
MDDEVGFLGFSYEVTACQSASQLKTDFKNIKQKYNGRYVRLYGACDTKGFYDNVVDAAWEAGVGVHALIWFGFEGGKQWETRRDSLLSDLTSNPKAKFVTRVVQFGSEPLFDNVLSASALASQVKSAKSKLADVQIPVTVSDMAYGYQSNGGAQDVLDAIDLVDAHILPFFGASSTTGAAAWSFVKTNLDFFTKNAKGKKIIFTENGWPSQETSDLKPNSKFAIGSVGNMENYFKMLDSHCEDLKAVEGGGVGWFFHLYTDSMELGYGLLKTSGQPKFTFSPRTSC